LAESVATGLGSVRTTQARPEAELLSHGEKVAMKAVFAGTISIALDDYGRWVVTEHVCQDAAEVDQRLAQAGTQRRRVLRHRDA
jgi:hypothetical protein